MHIIQELCGQSVRPYDNSWVRWICLNVWFTQRTLGEGDNLFAKGIILCGKFSWGWYLPVGVLASFDLSCLRQLNPIKTDSTNTRIKRTITPASLHNTKNWNTWVTPSQVNLTNLLHATNVGYAGQHDNYRFEIWALLKTVMRRTCSKSEVFIDLTKTIKRTLKTYWITETTHKWDAHLSNTIYIQ